MGGNVRTDQQGQVVHGATCGGSGGVCGEVCQQDVDKVWGGEEEEGILEVERREEKGGGEMYWREKGPVVFRN